MSANLSMQTIELPLGDIIESIGDAG